MHQFPFKLLPQERSAISELFAIGSMMCVLHRLTRLPTLLAVFSARVCLANVSSVDVADAPSWICQTTASVSQGAAMLRVDPTNSGSIASMPPVLAPRRLLVTSVSFVGDPFPVTPLVALKESFRAADLFWKANSHDRFTFDPVYVPDVLVAPASYRDDNNGASVSPATQESFYTAVIDLLRAYDASHGNSGLYLPENYDNEVIFYKTRTDPATGSTPVGGRADLGGRRAFLFNNDGRLPSGLFAHELGHCLGLSHANEWSTFGTSPIGAGIHREYGNRSDVMGLGLTSAIHHLHYTNWYKARLGWISAGDIAQPARGTQTIRLFRHDHEQASGTRMVVIPKSTTQEYYLEYRPGNLENPLLRRGLLIGWGNKSGNDIDAARGIELLDMTPQSTSVFEYTDHALALGRTFSDSDSGVHVTPLAVGGTTPNEYIDVAIQFSSGALNRAPSAGSIQSTSPSIKPGFPVELRIDGSDPDGDALSYAWDFSDGSRPQAGQRAVTTFLTAESTVVVTCTVSDRHGGSVVVTRTLPVERNPLRHWELATKPSGIQGLRGVAFGHGRFVAAGAGGTILVSDDVGGTWSTVTSPVVRDFTGVSFADDRFFITGMGTILASSNGTTWQSIAVPTANQNQTFYKVAFGAGRLAILSKASVLSCTPDYTDWRAYYHGIAGPAEEGSTTTEFRDIDYVAGRFIAVGNYSNAAISADGISWVSAVSTQGFPLCGVGSLDGTYVAARNVGGLQFSMDGLNWMGFSGSQNYFEAGDGMIAEGVGCFVAGTRYPSVPAAEGTIGIYTGDLTDLKLLAPTVNTSLWGVAFGLGRFVAVGGGTIIRSEPRPYPPSVFTMQPSLAAPATVGSRISMTTESISTAPITYQWQFKMAASPELNGISGYVDIIGATDSTFSVPSVQSFDAGNYRLIATSNGISVTSDPIFIHVAPAPASNARLMNLSTRALDLTGDNVLIPGFVLTGTGTKRVLIRGVGPTLGSFGVNGTLADPAMTLKSDSTTIATNDDWGTNANKAAIISTSVTVGAFALLDGSKDSALLVDLAPGAYTVPTAGNAGGTGVAMVELYDADAGTPTARLVNISNRGFVDVGDNIMIPGFVVSNEGSRTFLVRAVGPTLAAAPFNLTGTLADPVLTIFSGQNAILSNDDWSTAPGASTTASVAATVGAFALNAGSRDAAFVVTLPPGPYTVQATGKAGTTGIALVEVYLVP